MASPSVETREIDLSTRVPSFPGVAGSIVVRSTRGRTDRPFLVTSQADFLKKTTGNERIDIGMPNEYFSALTYLEKSNQLWIKRAVNRATFGASVVNSVNTDIALSNFDGAVAYSGSNNSLTINKHLGKKIKTGTLIRFTNSGGVLPTGLTTTDKYFAIKISDTEIQLATSIVDALPKTGNPVTLAITDNGTGTHSIFITNNLIVGDISSEWVTTEDTFKVSVSLGKNLQTGSQVLVSTKLTIPTGLTNNTFYFVIKMTDTQIKLATTRLNAINGIFVNITNAGTRDFMLLAKSNNGFDLTDNFTINTTDSSIVVPARIGSIISTGDSVTLDTEGSLTGTGITADTLYYAVKLSDTEFKISSTQANALASTPVTITLTTTGTGKHYVIKTDGALDFETYNFASNELMLLRAKDQGNWSKRESSGSIQWTIEDYRNKETDSFKIKIFKTSNLSVPVEEFVCSRVQGKQDGDGRNIYVEDVLKGSFYLEAIDNTLIADTEFPVLSTTPTALNGGDDGDPVTDGIMITNLQAFVNPDDIFTTLIMDGGFATPAYHQAIATLCESRKDCFGILSIPMYAELDADPVNAILDYRRSTNISSSFVSIYSSHQKILDRFNNRELFISPDGFVGAVISFTADNYEIWFAPAGWKRATLNVLEPLIKFDKGQRDILYDNGINPIRSKPNRGVAVFGNKTMLTRPSALDRANVRLLLIQITPANADALEDYEFEINDVATRSEVNSIIDDYMKDIQARRGVYDYFIVCDDTNNSETDIDNYVMNVFLFVKPTKTAEFIKLSIIITRTNSDFSVALQLV